MVISTKKRSKAIFFRLGVLCLLVGAGYCYGYTQALHKMKETLIAQQVKYEELDNNYQKNLAVTKATTKEVKRLSKELKETNQIPTPPLDLNDTTKVMAIIDNYVQENEAFSSIAYKDSDGKYRNGYGTVAKLKKYRTNEKVEVKTAKGKKITLTATPTDNRLPERSITKEEALKRFEDHVSSSVLPHIQDKIFHNEKELRVAIDVIYNRGIGHCKDLFKKDGTINCDALYRYMTHTNKQYQKAMRNRYAKNYALCVQL